MVDGFADAEPARAGPRARAARRAGARPARRRPPTRTARSTTRPFGGGAGMVLMPEPLFATVEAVDPPRPLLLLGPGGRRFDQAWARELAGVGRASRCCAAATRASTSGCARHLVDGELSVGDYVLAGGEVAAMVVLEAVGRLVPGRDGQRRRRPATSRSATACSSTRTTPGRPSFRGWEVPEVLTLGRPRPGRPLAAGPGPAAHDRRPARPDRGPRRAQRGRPGAAGRVPRPPAESRPGLCRVQGRAPILACPPERLALLGADPGDQVPAGACAP